MCSVASSRIVIEQHDLGPHGEGARDGDALLLSARKTRRVGVALVVKPDLSQKLLRRRHDLLALHALYLHRRFQQVAEHRHVRKEVELLEHHPHLQEDGAALITRGVLRMPCLVLCGEEVAVDLDRALVDIF